MKALYKTLILTASAAVAVPAAYAQQESLTNPCDEEGIIQTLAKIEKKSDKFNLYLNMHGDFRSDWTGSEFEGGKFEMKQLRVEAKGNINSWLRYRYRQRLNKGNDPNGYFDNLMRSIDIAGIGVQVNKFDFFLGKQCASYGGIEFDLNPIEIYQYSDMVDYMDNFMTGINIAYNFTPDQQLQFQILDGLIESSQAKYGDYTPAKLPLVYTLNWNGNFNDVFKTRWSASIMNEVKGNHMYYFALGNDFKISDKVGAYFDWMYSIEEVDRKGIITSIVGGNDPARMSRYADYMSFILHLNYRFAPAWNVFAKFMYENEGVYKTHVADYNGTEREIYKGKYRTALGYIAGLEFYPLKDRNLHFFLTYVGRNYQYTGKARAFGEKDYNTNRISAGFIWQMPVF